MNSLGNPYKQSNKTFLYYRLLSSVHRNSLLLESLVDVFFFFLIRHFRCGMINILELTSVLNTRKACYLRC